MHGILRVTDSCSSRCPLIEPWLWEAERPPTVPSLRLRGHLKVTAVPVRAEQIRERERNCSCGAVLGSHSRSTVAKPESGVPSPPPAEDC